MNFPLKKSLLLFLLGGLSCLGLLAIIGILYWIRLEQKIDKMGGMNGYLTRQRAAGVVNSINEGVAPLVISYLPEEGKIRARKVFLELIDKTPVLTDKDIHDLEVAFKDFRVEVATNSARKGDSAAKKYVDSCEEISRRH